MWSMLIIFSYLHIQKKTTPCSKSNTKYLLFGKGLVKEKLWDNLEEKKQQLCKTQITQLIICKFIGTLKSFDFIKTCLAGYVVVFRERPKEIVQWNFYSGDTLRAKAVSSEWRLR